MFLDLNCDLGEGEPPAKTRALMTWVDSVNIACGVHAGDLESMERCIRSAVLRGIRIGAHPGLPGQFGRARVDLSPAQFQMLLLHQVGGFEHVVHGQGAGLHHIKLHGALYHQVDSDPSLARAYLKTAARWFPGVRLFVRAGGRTARMAARYHVPIWEEGFVDRGYCPDGTLVSRGDPGALIHDPESAVGRVKEYAETGQIGACDGTKLALRLQTLCVHGDSPGAVEMARAVSRVLRLWRRA